MNEGVDRQDQDSQPFPVRTLLKIAVTVFVIALLAIILVAWLQGDGSLLPFEYEGFDK